MTGWRTSMCVAALATLAAGATAAPYVPQSDDVVLERLPEKGDPALAQLKRMRRALAARPADFDIAIPVARKALEAARQLGDPRFLGQAQAALAPWWTADTVPPAALLLRATLKQSQHDFDGSLKDLDRLLAAQPAAAQARLTRATVLGVQGRYADARRDCGELNGRVAPIVFLGCDAVPASLSGAAAARVHEPERRAFHAARQPRPARVGAYIGGGDRRSAAATSAPRSGTSTTHWRSIRATPT